MSWSSRHIPSVWVPFLARSPFSPLLLRSSRVFFLNEVVMFDPTLHSELQELLVEILLGTVYDVVLCFGVLLVFPQNSPHITKTGPVTS